MKTKLSKLTSTESVFSKSLSWTTIASEKALLAAIGIATFIAAAQYFFGRLVARAFSLLDLFMLFIYAEIIGMVVAVYSTNRIAFTLAIIVAITARCELIIMHSKEMDALVVLGEAGAILILSGAAYVMSMKEKVSIDKLQLISDKEPTKD